MHIDSFYNVDEKKIAGLAILDKEKGLSPEDLAIVEEAAHHCNIPALKIYFRHNPSAVFDILHKASKFDGVSSDVLLLLSLFYLKGICVEQDSKEGLRLLTEASKKGNIKATVALGDIYRDGLFGIDKSIENAFFYYSKGAEKDANSMVLLALLIRKNKIKLGDIDSEAYILKLNKQAASMGSVEALQNLATFYYKGEYVEKDFYKARIYLLNAIELGEKDYAFYNLYKIYMAEDSPFKDQAEAMKWLMKGIEEGSKRCKRELDTLNLPNQ